MPTPPTRTGPKRPSEPRLSEVAHHLVVPAGITSTGWPNVAKKLRLMGLGFDTWQQGLGKAILAKRADGSYAAGIGGVVMSIPRQVGKTYVVGALVFALCLIFPRLKVIWTAHHSNTADETFEAMSEMAQRPKIAPYISSVRTGNGKQVITFRNRSRIEFGARERGFGRGKTKVGLLVLDEAQILTENAMSNLVPAANQGDNPLIFLMGTPPKASDPSEVFTAKRLEAMSGTSEDMLYVEFSPRARVDVAKWTPGEVGDWSAIAEANPSYPRRTNRAAILRMRKMLPSADSFQHEALGQWDEHSRIPATISAEDWKAGHIEVAPREGKITYAVKFAVDGSRVALAAALLPADGMVHVEVVKVAPMSGGDAWLVDWLAARVRGSAGVVIDGKSGAGPLVNALRERRAPVRLIHTPTVDQIISAHAGFLAAVQGRNLTHYGQTGLNDVVAAATKRDIGKAGGWGWQGIDGMDTTPLDAVTLAHWLVATSKRKATTDKGEGRRGVVL